MTTSVVAQSWTCALFTLVGLLCFSISALSTLRYYEVSSRSDPILMTSTDDDRQARTIDQLQDLSKCLGAPYLYVTLHDKTANVLKYSRDGCLLSDNVLLMDEAYKSVFDVEFRSMAIGNHKDHESLFIADASDHNSRLLIFGKCIEGKENYGKRHFVEIVVDSKHNKGVDHTYGVCLDKDGNVYISNQHTDSVLRFKVGCFNPMALPRSLQLDGRLDYFDGTFVQFGLPREHGQAEQGVRAIAHVHGKIWIAHEGISGVAVTDVDSGLVTDIIPLDTPVGLFHDEAEGIVYVSCRSRNRGGIVYALDSETFTIRHAYSHHRMIHPTGERLFLFYSTLTLLYSYLCCILFLSLFYISLIHSYLYTISVQFKLIRCRIYSNIFTGMTTYDGILYVAEQNIGAILSFEIQSERFIRKVVGGYDKLDRIEQLVLSPC